MPNLILVTSPTNRNSLAALYGALDVNQEVAGRFNLKLLSEAEVVKIDPDQPAIVGFSFQTPDVFRIQKLIAKLTPKGRQITLIAGGSHPSGAPEHALNLGFDFVFVGESEGSLITFLAEFSTQPSNYGNVPGLVFKQGSRIVINRPAPPVNINCFLPVSPHFPIFTPIEISRGCPHGCRFCQTTYLFGRVRHRTVEQIVDSTKILIAQGFSQIRFVSPNLLAYGSKDGLKPNLSQLEKMLRSVRSVPGVQKVYAGSFPSEVRPESISRETLEILKQYSDNDNLIVGFQSGSDSVLRRMHRQHTAEQALNATQLALEMGFRVNVDFIFGTPRETKKEEAETIAVLRQLAKLPKVKIHGHTFLPLPGTPWQSEPPRAISSNLRELLDDLASNKRLYGDWASQEILAKQISTLGL